MLPILERLLFKPKQQTVTRVLVLVPTRELAIQVYQVSKQLSQFTNVEISLSAGKRQKWYVIRRARDGQQGRQAVAGVMRYV